MKEVVFLFNVTPFGSRRLQCIEAHVEALLAMRSFPFSFSEPSLTLHCPSHVASRMSHLVRNQELAGPELEQF